MIRRVEYTAPVLAFVDTELGEVVGVRVDNHSAICPTGNVFAEDWGALTEEQRAEALHIAESTLWPRWRVSD